MSRLNLMDIRRTAVKAMISEQYPWVELDDITVIDNTGWSQNPHFHVELVDDGKHIEVNLAIVSVEVNEDE